MVNPGNGWCVRMVNPIRGCSDGWIVGALHSEMYGGIVWECIHMANPGNG